MLTYFMYSSVYLLILLYPPCSFLLWKPCLFSMSVSLFVFVNKFIYIFKIPQKWYHMICVFVYLTSLSMIISRSIHVAANGIISFFFMASSVQFSRSVMSNSLQPYEPQHTRPPCPSPTPGVHPDPCPLSRWCHPTISSSVVPFSSCPQSFPASGSFQMSQLFTSGGQSIGVSVSTSVLPVIIQDL